MKVAIFVAIIIFGIVLVKLNYDLDKIINEHLPNCKDVNDTLCWTSEKCSTFDEGRSKFVYEPGDI